MYKPNGSNTPDHAAAARYAECKARYGRALRAGCYLECVFIDYAMMEDRLLSILHHLNIADRALGKGCRWATSPKPRRAGYRAALSSMIPGDGSLPRLGNICTKIDVLEALASLGDCDGACEEYEIWLRTEVRNKLQQYGTVSLCKALNDWRDKRNDLTHHLFGNNACNYDAEELRVLAVEGMALVKSLDNISGAMARLMKKYEERQVRRR